MIHLVLYGLLSSKENISFETNIICADYKMKFWESIKCVGQVQEHSCNAESLFKTSIIKKLKNFIAAVIFKHEHPSRRTPKKGQGLTRWKFVTRIFNVDNFFEYAMSHKYFLHDIPLIRHLNQLNPVIWMEIEIFHYSRLVAIFRQSKSFMSNSEHEMGYGMCILLTIDVYGIINHLIL